VKASFGMLPNVFSIVARIGPRSKSPTTTSVMLEGT
jgi:hypothetical protein